MSDVRPWHRPLNSFPWLPVKEPWSERLMATYLKRKAEAVSIEFGASCEFVRGLPNLRYVGIFTRMRDDTAVFDVPSVEYLMLFDHCKKPLAADRLPKLLSLECDNRPGVESLRDHSSLARLRIHNTRVTDVEWLGRPPSLAELGLMGAGQTMDTMGLEALGTLEDLQLSNVNLAQPEHLGSLTGLRGLVVVLPRNPSGPLDLSCVRELPHLESLTVETRGELLDVDALWQLPIPNVSLQFGPERKLLERFAPR